MKLLAIILFLPTLALASGPKYSYKDAHLDDEINNIYQDILHLKNVDIRTSTAAIRWANITSGTATTFNITNSTITTGYVGSLSYGSITTPGTGRVLQILYSSTTSGTGTTSSTFQAVTNIKVTITLANSANKVMIWGCGAGQNNNANSNQLNLTVKRDTNNLGEATGGFASTQNTATGQTTHISTLCFVYADAPGGTGPYVYQAFIRSSDNTNSVSWPNPGAAVMVVEETN